MASRLPPEDTLPWYRQFWPWFLIMLPASVVVAGFSTLYIANRHADDLVADEYYKEGLAINRQLEKKERAAHRGIEARLLIDGEQIQVSLTGNERAELLQLRLSHPPEESGRAHSAGPGEGERPGRGGPAEGRCGLARRRQEGQPGACTEAA